MDDGNEGVNDAALPQDRHPHRDVGPGVVPHREFPALPDLFQRGRVGQGGQGGSLGDAQIEDRAVPVGEDEGVPFRVDPPEPLGLQAEGGEISPVQGARGRQAAKQCRLLAHAPIDDEGQGLGSGLKKAPNGGFLLPGEEQQHHGRKQDQRHHPCQMRPDHPIYPIFFEYHDDQSFEAEG
ncbi:hypothetical protein B2D07_19955 [Desulfococcus multivorans]|nr:hypothetical protein B2D07_19955 [Desulfococcus multivorans]